MLFIANVYVYKTRYFTEWLKSFRVHTLNTTMSIGSFSFIFDMWIQEFDKQISVAQR